MENLLWLILLIIYLVLQFVGSKKQPQQPERRAPSGRPDVRRPDGGRPPAGGLEEALREIREALGGEPDRPTRREEPETPLAPASPSAPTRLERRLPDESLQTTTPAPKHLEQTGFAGKEDFERHATRVTRAPEPVAAPRNEIRTPHRATAQTSDRKRKPTTSPAPVKEKPLLRRLRDPQSVRDAILLSEVLGPPRSRRP